MNPCPGAGVCDLQFAAQLGIPGACCHGLDSLVPAFESDPFAAIKKQLFPDNGALAGQPLADTVPDIENEAIKDCQASLLWMSVMLVVTEPDGALKM